MSALTKGLARETSAYDVHFWDVIDDFANITMDGVPTRLPPIRFVYGCCMSVNICCEHTLMAQSVESGMEAPDTTEQVNESHG